MKRLFQLFAFITSCHLAGQSFSPYSEIHWRPDQSSGQESRIRKVVGDSLGNTYLLYVTDRDFRVKSSDYLLMKSIISYGAGSFVLKLDPNGDYQWGMCINGGAISDIACDNKGNLFTSAVGSTIPGHFMLAYLPGSSVMAEGACNLVMKISPAGQMIWYVKDTMDMYSAFSRLWLDAKGNLFQYVMTNGSRQNEARMQKFNPNGSELWRTSLNYAFPYAVEVNKAGETYYSCHTYKMSKNGLPAYPPKGDAQEIWKLDVNGVKSVVLTREYPKHHDTDKWNWIEGDYFINNIAFNADHTPVFYTSILMQHDCEYIVIMGKKYYEANGSFVFAKIGMDGEIVTDLQLKVSTLIFERDFIESMSVGVLKRHGQIYLGNDKWLFGIPANRGQSETNPVRSHTDANITYITFDSRTKAITFDETTTTYLANYRGVGFGYSNDSTLYAWGRREDCYIDRSKPGEPTTNSIVPSIPAVSTIVNVPTVIDSVTTISSSAVDSIGSPLKTHNALLYPNPSSTNSIVQFELPMNLPENSPGTVYVYDSEGRMLDNVKFNGVPGTNKVELFTYGYAMGYYTVKVICAGMEYQVMMIKI